MSAHSQRQDREVSEAVPILRFAVALPESSRSDRAVRADRVRVCAVVWRLANCADHRAANYGARLQLQRTRGERVGYGTPSLWVDGKRVGRAGASAPGCE